MKELFESCKKLILDNYKGHINDSSLEAMTIAVMALCLRNEKRTLDKLPKILQNIEIFAEDKSVLEIAKNNISTFSDEMVDGNIGACVIRGFGTDDDTGEIYEEKCLVVSTVNLNDNPSDVIMKITHELTHLLRDQKFEADGKSIKTKNGISIVRVRDLSTGEKKTKHFYFEEGIVQRYTNQALDILREFVYKEELDDNSLLKRFRNDYPSKVRSAYDLQVQIVDTLCKDKQFDDAVDASFEETCTPASLITYYNNKMNDSTAFTSLSKDVDSCFIELVSGSKESTEKYYRSALTKVATFLKLGKTKKYI